MTYESFIELFEKRKAAGRGVSVRCPSHEDGTASLSVGRSRDGGVILKCFAGCRTEDIVARMGLTMKDLFAETKPTPGYKWHPPAVTTPTKTDEELESRPVLDKIYSYTDALGRELYQALRLKPKSFRQRHKVGNDWLWNMDGVERVLYRLPEVMKSETVWIVEGEKDAENLAILGFCSTCNVGGAGKWLDGYTESLVGKEVVLCGDNDDAGRKHIELVFESIAPNAKSVRVVKLPETIKDASDYIATFSDAALARLSLSELASAATPHIGGVRMPVYSMADIEPLYKRQVDQSQSVMLDLGLWLPSFKNKIRPIVPGEVVLLLGDTGTGKSALLQNIAVCSGLNSLFFEMELPPELMFERFMAIQHRLDCSAIEQEYRTNPILGTDMMMKLFPNIFICPESGLTASQLETIIIRSELKIGSKPVVVLIDYVQLMRGKGDRYEKTSDLSEGLKVIAKTTRTIIVVASQVSRASSDDEIGLHSGKDSGALENSAGLVLGAWRTEKDPTLMEVKVLKSTKGGAGLIIHCNFDGSKMRITERSKISDDDVPSKSENYTDR